MYTLKILIVDDDLDYVRIIGMLLQRRLSDENYRIEIMSATTLAEGLRLAAEANCTILDLGLPDVDDPHDAIAAIPLFRPPVIVVTGNDDPIIHKACEDNKADHIFIKGQTHGLSSRVIDCLMRDIVDKKKQSCNGHA